MKCQSVKKYEEYIILCSIDDIFVRIVHNAPGGVCVAVFRTEIWISSVKFSYKFYNNKTQGFLKTGCFIFRHPDASPIPAQRNKKSRAI